MSLCYGSLKNYHTYDLVSCAHILTYILIYFTYIHKGKIKSVFF